VDVTELTRDEMTRLQSELDNLRGPRRAEIVEAIAVARGHGDLSENFEYHAAKNEQGLLERQITLLEQKLASAVVVEKATVANGGLAGTGAGRASASPPRTAARPRPGPARRSRSATRTARRPPSRSRTRAALAPSRRIRRSARR